MASIVAVIAIIVLCSVDAQKPRALMRRAGKDTDSRDGELVSLEIGKHGDLLAERQAPSWWDPTEDCPEHLYGYDSNGKCRTDSYKPPNGVLDRFAKTKCCEAYEAAQSAHKAEAATLAAGTVKLWVKGARGLPDMDPAWGSGHSDAFVEAKVGSQKQTSGHAPSTANPEWSWAPDFNVGASSTVSELLRLEVYDHDVGFNFWWDGHDKISDLDVQFRTLPPNEWVKFEEAMKTSTGGNAGVIAFEVKWVPSS